jgi:hypothetical protein
MRIAWSDRRADELFACADEQVLARELKCHGSDSVR